MTFVLFIGLNPSTADEARNDPTITREQNFAQAWDHTTVPDLPYQFVPGHRFMLTRPGMAKGNLFSKRSTDPRGLLDDLDRACPEENYQAIIGAAKRAAMVIAAWGGPYQPRALHDAIQRQVGVVVHTLAAMGIRQIYCLGTSKLGHPRHPLYLKKTTVPVLWKER